MVDQRLVEALVEPDLLLWKRQAMEGLTAVFSGRSAAQESAKAAEADIEKLHAKIGQLVVERDFLAKASGR